MANPELPTLPADFWQKSCDGDLQLALEQYVSMYHNAFKPATSPSPYGGISLYFQRQCIRECHERLEKQTTKDVMVGTAKRKVDDMLEMSLRLISGIQVKFNEAAGVSILEEIMKGKFPDAKKAIAASLACQIILRNIIVLGFDIEKAVALAEMSAGYGLFSHTCMNLMRVVSAGNGLKVLDNSELMKGYKQYREETGEELPRSRRCAACDKQPEKRSMLKECAGPCFPENKPVYCSRECQKVDWPKHRKWCKLEVVESDEEWTTDSEYDLFEEDTSTTDEEEELPAKSGDTRRKNKAS